MSDGSNDATLDHRRTPGAGNGQRTTPAPPATQGAAPWERFSEPPADHNARRWQAEPPPAEPVVPEAGETEQGGCHTGGGLTVADLIAKIGAPDNPHRSSHRHAAPDTDSPDAAPDPPVDLEPTQVIDIPAYSLDLVSELLDLEAADYPNGDESEFDHTEVHGASGAVTSRAAKKAAKTRKPKSRRRPILLAARSLAALFAALALALTGA